MLSELELSPIEAEIEDLIPATPALGKHCGRSAIRHTLLTGYTVWSEKPLCRRRMNGRGRAKAETK